MNKEYNKRKRSLEIEKGKTLSIKRDGCWDIDIQNMHLFIWSSIHSNGFLDIFSIRGSFLNVFNIRSFRVD